MFTCHEKQLLFIAHVDDLHATGPEKELLKLFKDLGKDIALKLEPWLKPGGDGTFRMKTC